MPNLRRFGSNAVPIISGWVEVEIKKREKQWGCPPASPAGWFCTRWGHRDTVTLLLFVFVLSGNMDGRL